MTWVGSAGWDGDATGFGTVVATREDVLVAGLVVAGPLLVAGALDAVVVAVAGATGAGMDGVVVAVVADGGVDAGVPPSL
jgi:hypothetical protein